MTKGIDATGQTVMPGLIDTHCHLDVSAFDPDREQVLFHQMEFILLAALVPTSWSERVRDTERVWLHEGLGATTADAVVERAERWYDMLFVSPGLVETSYRITLPGDPNADPGDPSSDRIYAIVVQGNQQSDYRLEVTVTAGNGGAGGLGGAGGEAALGTGGAGGNGVGDHRTPGRRRDEQATRRRRRCRRGRCRRRLRDRPATWMAALRNARGNDP